MLGINAIHECIANKIEPSVQKREMKRMALNNWVENEEKPLFQLFFLKDVHAHPCIQNQDVKLLETARIPFTKIRQRLEQGESILITPKKEEQPSVQEPKDDKDTVWYFTHM